ncbi:MAG: HEPN domain-containing protein [bacterium]
MLRDPGDYRNPHEWIKRAKSNLIRARQPKVEGILWEDLCFDTQQAVEKALKAVLLSRGIRFRFVHDIAELLTILEKHAIHLPDEIRAAAGLTDYAVETRYPGTAEPVTEEEFKEALRTAEAVVVWAQSLIDGPSCQK